MSQNSSALKFAPFAGALDVSFFSELGRRKLHDYGLDDAPVDVCGSFARAERREVSSPLCLSADAFTTDASGVPANLCVAPGTLRNANTLEDFKEWDKSALLEGCARLIADDIASGAALCEPTRLLRFLLLTFADLKTHKFYYWFGFPAFALTPPPAQKAPPVTLASALGDARVQQLVEGYTALAAAGALAALDVSDAAAAPVARAPPFFAVHVPTDASGALEVGPLASFAGWRATLDGETLLAFCDPCPLAGHPGWPLRNLLALAATLLHGAGADIGVGASAGCVRVICFREPPLGASTSITTSAAAAGGAAAAASSLVLSVEVAPPAAALVTPGAAMPSVVGWEKNSNGKLGPRLMDLSAQMDPYALAEASVDLNLRLMKWRLMPSLQTEQVAATKCLLMGAGTLGCAVARCLIGWGVRHVTFVDSGVVSYSNPVRQSLFTFDDCLEGGKPKAQAAADRLTAVFPKVTATAHRLSIPMPGHAVPGPDTGRVEAECAQLCELVSSHDVVFLLTDTRESRWLPTLLAAHHGKLAINAALGFDSLLLRASLPMFRVDSMVGRAFDKCTACSATVLEAYKARGFAFLLEAFNRATYLEDLTGLTQMHAETEKAMEDVGIFDEDDEDDE